jgi:hypothetical protein
MELCFADFTSLSVDCKSSHTETEESYGSWLWNWSFIPVATTSLNLTLGGSIAVESTQGVGSSFSVNLPFVLSCSDEAARD